MTPPALATWLLQRRVPSADQEFLLGDLEERFREIAADRGASAARRWYWREALATLLRPWPRRHSESMDLARGDGPIAPTLRDLRFGIRAMRRAPLFALVVVLTFAIGLGATGAIFSVLDPVLLQGAPYPEADRLSLIWGRDRDGSESNVGYLTFRDVERESRSLSAVAVMGSWSPTLVNADGAERLEGQRVSQRFFSILGVQPALGRDFLPEEDHAATRTVVILSYGLWQRRFAGDSNIIGKKITLGESSFTVVGVMPRSFESLLSPTSQLWRPLGYEDGDPWACRDCQHLRMIGRLKNGVTPAAAGAELNRISAEMVAAHPTSYPAVGMLTTPLNGYLTRNVRPVLFAISAAVALLLLIACVNVTHLFLGRALERSTEFAVRTALGAGQAPLLRQVIVESLALSLVGGALGVVFAFVGVRTLVRLAPAGVPRLDQVAVNGQVLMFTLIVATLAGLLAGLAPAIAVGRVNLGQMLRQGGRTIRRGSHRLRAVLVVGEVALALVLLAGAGLLVRSLDRLFEVSPGFNSDRLLTVELDLYGSRYDSIAAVQQFYARTVERVSASPGVAKAAVVTQLPLSGDFDSWGMHFESKPSANPADDLSAFRFGVSPGYLKTMEIPLIRGRDITAEDTRDAPPVILINQALARRVFPGEEPLGQRVKVAGTDGPWRTIVGVVGDVHHQGLDAGDELQFYMPYTQAPWSDGRQVLIVRSTGADPITLMPAIRQAIREVDPTIPVASVATMTEHIRTTAAIRRFARAIFQAFAAVALLLAGLGLYGVLAGSVAERRGEIGIRSALGAPQHRILALVARHALGLTCIGLLIGLGGAVFLAQLLRSLLFGVTASDPLTLAAVTLLLVLVALAAAGVPAWRAANVDPAVVLRDE
jgi:putative ABC transport system permease protein